MRWQFGDDERWTAAFSVARGRPMENARVIRTADQWRVGGLSALVGVVVVVALFATDLGDLFYGSGGTRSSVWRTVLSGVGYALAVGGFVMALPRSYGLERVPGLPKENPAQWLTRPQRDVVDRQITGADAFDPFLLVLSHDRAGRALNGPLPLLQFAAVPILLASVTRGGPVTVVVGLWALTVVAVALALPQQRAFRAAARRFVTEHGQDVAS